MTTLNTIIEEEKKVARITWIENATAQSSSMILDEILTTAMQRAYEAGQVGRDTYWKERVNHILDSHIEMARDSLKNAVADQAAPYKHQLGRLLQTKSEILNILSDNLN